MYVNRQIYMQRNSKHVPRERGGRGRGLHSRQCQGAPCPARSWKGEQRRPRHSPAADRADLGRSARTHPRMVFVFVSPPRADEAERAFISRRRVFYSLCPKPTRGLPGARRNPSGNGLPKRTSSLPVSHAEGVAGISSARRETPSAPHLLPDVVLLRALPRPPVKSAPVKPEGRHIS